MSDRLSVLLVGYAHGDGGITTHTHWLARGLVERGHVVSVVSPYPIDGHTVTPWPNPGYSVDYYGGVPDALRGFAALGRKRFDVAVVAGTGWKAMGGVLANRRIKRRVFFEVMSGDVAGIVDPRRLVHAGFDAAIGLATSVDDKFRRNFHWKGKGAIIPALPEPLERVAAIPDRGLIVPTGGKVRAVYFGRLAPHKGVSLLVEQWPTLSERLASLDIYGTGPDAEMLAQRIAEAGLGDVIRLHGRYPDGQGYADLLAQYDLLLLPTVGQEGGPLVLLEAMACGVPFVANGMGGIPDFANQDCRITSGDIDEFVPLVVELADEMVAGRIDGSRLQRHYRDHFSFDVLVGKWEGFLQSVALAKPGNDH
jgi:glycosyltransferase involved in cell wall biosynthesis